MALSNSSQLMHLLGGGAEHKRAREIVSRRETLLLHEPARLGDSCNSSQPHGRLCPGKYVLEVINYVLVFPKSPDLL